jgi:hypothetical protein
MNEEDLENLLVLTVHEETGAAFGHRWLRLLSFPRLSIALRGRCKQMCEA